MINRGEILETIEMIDQQHLDVRTITMGISLLDCCDSDPKAACRKIYDKITRSAKDLVRTGEDIEAEFGIPIVNKRISVTPIALVAGASDCEDYVCFAEALDNARRETGVNFVGGFSALVQKGMTPADEKLIRSIPRAPRGDGARLLERQRRLDQGRHKHGRRRDDGPRHKGDGGAHPPPRAASAARSSSYSATPWRTTPSWPAPSTA